MDPQNEVKELIESARRHQSAGELAALVALGLAVLLLLYGAYQTYRKGFKISESNTLTGRAATVIAIIMALGAVALGVWGVWFVPSMFR